MDISLTDPEARLLKTRNMERWIHEAEAEAEAMLERLANAPETPLIRKQTV
ncbi:hypothetical protein GCM10011338_10260 [Alteromonas lipolytica]|nr:hypothetical protein GCM10011338_10260 [Alteromonas lipolytica]